MGKLSLTGYRTRSRHADLSTVAAFDPVTSIAWAHLYYAGGPAFQALGLSDGASMSGVDWPDEITANAAALDTGFGTYRAADSAFNSKPSVQMTASAGKRHSTTVASGKQVTQPFSVVVIFQIGSLGTSQYVTDGANEGSSGTRVLLRTDTGPAWTLYMGGTARTGGTVTTGIKAARIYATSGNDTLTVNGSTATSGSNAGDGTWQGTSFSETSVLLTGYHAFYGVYAGDITADGQWSAFQAWVTTTYGVSIS